MSVKAAAYRHDKLIELLQRVNAVSGVSQTIWQTVQEIVSPNERILSCYYQLEMREEEVEQGVEAFYSCELVLITTGSFVKIDFFPKVQRYQLTKVYRISDIQVENRIFTEDAFGKSTEPVKGLAQPRQFTMVVKFQDEYGRPAAVWEIESTKPENVKNLIVIARTLNRFVGQPLETLQV